MVTRGLSSKISSSLFEYGSYILKLIRTCIKWNNKTCDCLFNRIILIMQPENAEEDHRKEDAMAKHKLNA